MNKILKALQGIIAPPLAKIEAQIEHLHGDFERTHQTIADLANDLVATRERVSKLEAQYEQVVDVIEPKVWDRIIHRLRESPPQPPLLEE